jgi:hypothetical protein
MARYLLARRIAQVIFRREIASLSEHALPTSLICCVRTLTLVTARPDAATSATGIREAAQQLPRIEKVLATGLYSACAGVLMTIGRTCRSDQTSCPLSGIIVICRPQRARYAPPEVRFTL